MTPYERVMNRLAGKPVDRLPNVNILMQFAAREIGQLYGKYVSDHRVLVEANLRCCQIYGIDMVSTISDPFREVADRGGKVTILPDDVPSCHEFLIQQPSDLKTLKLVDPTVGPRMRDRVDACRLYKKEVGGHYPILGWVEGPLAEACDLRGINTIMMDLFDEPAFVEDLMRNCNEQALWFAKAQIEAGADFIGIGDAAVSLIGPELYEAHVFERQRELIEGIHALGAKVKLHICGNVTDLLPLLARTGADMVDLDSMVPLAEAARIFAGGSPTRAVTTGNLNPVTEMQQTTPAGVEEAVRRAVSLGGDRLFASGGCEVPKFTPKENLLAFARALET